MHRDRAAVLRPRAAALHHDLAQRRGGQRFEHAIEEGRPRPGDWWARFAFAPSPAILVAAMLTGTSDFQFGDTRIRTAFVLGQRFHAQLVWRNGLLADSSFLVPHQHGRDIATLYLVHDGSVAVRDRQHELPVGFALAAREYERYEAGCSYIRSWGDPSVTLDLQLDATHVRTPIGLEHGPLAITDPTWEAFVDFAEAFAVAKPLDEAMLALVRGLVADHILAPELAQAATPVPPSLARLWEALRPFYGRWELSLELAELGLQAALSSRQLRRDAKMLHDWLGLEGISFRDHLHVLRLRAAVLLLSARGATVGEVAQRSGYGSVDAIGRAFRDAGLPPPHVVRDAVLSPG